MKRGIIIVLDSVGIGAQPDAGLYGDEGSNTLGHIHKELKDLPWFSLANLERLGLGHIDGVDYLNKSHPAIGSFARMMELSKGKDTTTGHWEIAGIVLDKPFPVYPDGFPTEIMQSFEEAIGRKTLGNFPASGTQIIADLGAEHMKTGFPIVYTSADSVFQIAAHEEVIPLKLYMICARKPDGSLQVNTR
jgi:phosphopentomutase